MSETCVFCRIARGELPSRKVFEDEQIFAFHDIRPQAPVHFMVIPKTHVASLAECDGSHEGILGRIMAAVARLARQEGLDDGFRVIINTGRVGRQEVPHLHVHVVGGSQPLGRMLPAAD